MYETYVVRPGTQQSDSALKRIEQETKEQVPQLPVPASKDQCLAAANELEKKCAEIWRRRQLERIEIDRWFNEARYFHTEVVRKASRTIDPEAVLENGLAEMREAWQNTKDTLVQECLLSMVKSQNEELKSWFWKEVVGKHRSKLQLVESTRPDTKFGDTGARSSLQAPVEVMEMVFDCADLETCVALRRVSKAWYSCFSNIEDTLKDKLQKRNPWMKPGDVDLQTWADCVLVFVSRKLGQKWQLHTGPLPSSWEIPPQTSPEDSLPDSVVGMEMDFGDTLPKDFCAVSEFQCFQQGEFQVRWVSQESIKLVRDDMARRSGMEDELEGGDK
ncbi:hypothetical protein CJU90_5330 [Yarrowia sp. C11]|nr:hypothetical protein CJU90_5330 [Yarrowia sp. C11]